MKIILGEFKDNGEELAEFLEPRIGVKPKSSGDGLDIDDDSVRKAVKPRHVKTYIKRFLLKQGDRKLYKIIVEGTELTMVYLEQEEDEEKEKEAKKREEEKAKREEEQKREGEATPEEAKQEADSEKAAEAKEEARAENKEEEEKEGALKEEEPSKKQRKPRKKAD
jgi:hypothetical protein